MAGLIFIGLMIGWFYAVRRLARFLTRGIQAEGWRVLAISIFVMVMMVLPLSDEIVGGYQFRNLCKENVVLKIDAEKIKGKTIRVTFDPSDKELEKTAVRIYFSRASYRDVETDEELASYSS